MHLVEGSREPIRLSRGVGMGVGGPCASRDTRVVCGVLKECRARVRCVSVTLVPTGGKPEVLLPDRTCVQAVAQTTNTSKEYKTCITVEIQDRQKRKRYNLIRTITKEIKRIRNNTNYK